MHFAEANKSTTSRRESDKNVQTRTLLSVRSLKGPGRRKAKPEQVVPRLDLVQPHSHTLFSCSALVSLLCTLVTFSTKQPVWYRGAY